jgi:hypothetical protein
VASDVAAFAGERLVYSVSVLADVPVFHRFGFAKRIESARPGGDAKWVDVTQCGIEASALTGLRADHAAAIGRPCRRCFV